MTQFARHFLLALQFFTRIPVTGWLAAWVGFSPAMLRASAAHFPGVGWVVGGLTAAVLWVLLALLPLGPAAAWVAVVLSTVFGVMLSAPSMKMAWPTWPTAWAAAPSANARWRS